MRRRFAGVTLGTCLTGLALLTLWPSSPMQQSFADDTTSPDKTPPAAASVEEARSRARLLYTAIDGALQVMHRDFFDDEDSLRIPSRSLEDVFAVLSKDHDIKLRWLAVNAQAMSVDHNPQNDFERGAVKAIMAGQQEFDAAEEGTYRYAGMIRLGGECLKCHVPMRRSLEDRFAGLVISMPLKASPSDVTK